MSFFSSAQFREIRQLIREAEEAEILQLDQETAHCDNGKPSEVSPNTSRYTECVRAQFQPVNAQLQVIVNAVTTRSLFETPSPTPASHTAKATPKTATAAFAAAKAKAGDGSVLYFPKVSFTVADMWTEYTHGELSLDMSHIYIRCEWRTCDPGLGGNIRNEVAMLGW